MRRRGIGRVGRPSLIGTAARTAVIAGTATAVSGKVAAGQAAAAQQAAAQQGIPQAPPPAPEATAAPAAGGLTDDMVDQLKKLAELRDAGILTDEEFAAKKSSILGL
jgi:hypothetical protein